VGSGEEDWKYPDSSMKISPQLLPWDLLSSRRFAATNGIEETTKAL